MQSKGAEGNAVFCLWILLVVVVTAYYYPSHLCKFNAPWWKQCLGMSWFHAFYSISKRTDCFNLKALMTTFMMVSKDFLSLILTKIV